MTAVESEYVIGPLHRHKYGLTNYYQAKKCERENFLSNTFSNNLCYLFLLWVPMSVLWRVGLWERVCVAVKL